MQKFQKAGFIVYHLPTAESTNNYAAMPENQPKLPHKSVIMSDFQTHGKGQHGKHWESEKGKNLLISIVMRPENFPVSKRFLLNCIAALTIRDVISYFLQKESKIKWPNDIYTDNRKIAGILIETAISGQHFNRIITGMGLNINQTKFESGDFTSFKKIDGRDSNPLQVLEFLLYKYDYWYSRAISSSTTVHDEFDKSLMGLDEWRNYSLPKGKTFEGKNRGTDTGGRLLIMNKKGEVNRYNHREVLFR